MGWSSTPSIREHAKVEPLEQRTFLSVTAIQDLTIDPASNGRPAMRFVVSNGIGFFIRFGELSIGSLWRTDGLTATRLKGVDPLASFQMMQPVAIGVVGMHSGQPNIVQRSDGTTAGTISVATVNAAHWIMQTTPIALRGHYYFADDVGQGINRGIYETDGTTLWFHGRILGAVSGAAEYGDGIVFDAIHSLYRISSAGQMVKFVDESTLVDQPEAPFNVSSGIVFLVRKDLEDNDQYTLWQTDATLAGTVRLPVSFGNVTRDVDIVGSDKQRALIQVSNRRDRRSLWSTDGRAEGTVEIKLLAKGNTVEVVGNTRGHTLFVVRESYDVTTAQLWATDGTPQSTRLLTELNPWSAYPNVSFSQSLSRIDLTSMPATDAATYFVNSDAEHGAEIWRTDGTPEGTRLAYDLVPGPDSGKPLLAGIVENRLVFNATLDGHLGLFAVDLKSSPVLAPPPLQRSAGTFSDTPFSRRASDDSVDALDVLTAASAV